MRKRISVILVVVGLMVLITSSAVKCAGIGIGGTLGFVSLNMGDLKDWNQTYKDYCDSVGRTSTLGNFQSDILYGAQGKFSFGENFMLRFGYSHLSGKQELEVTDPAWLEEKFTHQVSAHAITSSLILAMPLSAFTLYGGGGLGYYLADYAVTDESLLFGEIQWKGKGSAIGFHGFLGTEILLGKSFSISLEALYRIAKIPYLDCTESNGGISTVGDHIKRVVDYTTGELKDLELDFGGLSILAALHIYL